MDELIKYGSVSITPRLLYQSYCHTTVVVVGCGGTGGRLIPELAQHICNHNNEIRINPRNKQFLKHEIELLLVDMDTVELKNLKRQNFFKFDIGKNKARVFAERYSALYGMNISYSENAISEECNQLRLMRGDNMIIFDCTDNVKARRAIENSLPASNNVLISCGNEDTFGQVLVGCRDGGNIKSGRVLVGIRNDINTLVKAIAEPDMKRKISFHSLPTLLELYRDFKDTEKPSCTEIVLQDDQSMPINATVAQLAYNVFYNVIAGNELKYNMVKCNISNVMNTNFITHPKELLRLYIAGLMGSFDPEAQVAYREFNDKLGANASLAKYDEMVALIDKHGKFSEPFIRIYMQNNWNLNAGQTTDLNNRIREWESANI